MTDGSVMIKERLNNRRDVYGGEDIRYGEIHRCVDEFCSGRVDAVNGDRIRGRVLGLVSNKATSQGIEMDKGKRE